MMFTALALAAQPAPTILPSENVSRASTLWGHCNGLKAVEFARRPDPVDAVVAAVIVACGEAERETYDVIVRDHGEQLARGSFPMMREHARRRIRQTVLEARGAPRERGPDDVALVWGECVGARSALLAAGDSSPDEIASAALEHCAERERDVRAWAARQGGEEIAERYMADMRVQARAQALRRVALERARR